MRRGEENEKTKERKTKKRKTKERTTTAKDTTLTRQTTRRASHDVNRQRPLDCPLPLGCCSRLVLLSPFSFSFFSRQYNPPCHRRPIGGVLRGCQMQGAWPGRIPTPYANCSSCLADPTTYAPTNCSTHENGEQTREQTETLVFLLVCLFLLLLLLFSPPLLLSSPSPTYYELLPRLTSPHSSSSHWSHVLPAQLPPLPCPMAAPATKGPKGPSEQS